MTTPVTLSILLLDDTAGPVADDGRACDAQFYDAVSALLNELRYLSPVWPETAETVAVMLGWDEPTDIAAIEQELVRRAERAEAKALTQAERTVLHAARDLSRAQAEVEAALTRWAATPDAPTEAPEYVRLTAARRARNNAADRLYNVASRDLAENPATDVPNFLRAYLPATEPATNGRRGRAPRPC